MRLDHSFTVPVPVERAWAVLLDLPRIAPCMPGATLTGVDGDTFTGTVKVKLGPIALTYQGKGRFVERDEAGRRVVIQASGKDTRSAGTATATVTAVLAGEGDNTRVDVGTDLTVTGRPAQFGRGMIADVGAKLIGQFADCVARTLAAAPEPPSAPAPEPPSAPVPAAQSAPAADRRPAEPALAQPAPVSAEAEPIDLLRLTGSTATGRRLAGYAFGTVLLATLAWVTVRWLHR
jgi:carbon monoxide dehydrogenase subunit G